MRKLVYYVASTIDGFIARLDGSVDWCFADQDYGYKQFYDSVDTVVMGYSTWRKGLEFEKEPYADKQAIVFSKKHEISDKRVLTERNPINCLRKLKKENGKAIWLVGGGKTASQLLNAGLLDELVVSVHPIVLGNGIPLLENPVGKKLKLVGFQSFDSGLVQLHYEIARN